MQRDMMVYRSKAGLGLLIPIAVLLGGILLYSLIIGEWVGFFFELVIIAFVTHMLVTTYYTIKGDTLNVHCGFFYNTDIDIKKIKLIVETNSAFSAPALSFDRIELFYNTYDSVVISPGDKMGFISALTAVNNNIEIRLKK